jgi:hypothetical protein
LKKTNLALLVTCIVLALALVAIACTQAAAPTTSTPGSTTTSTVKDKTYKVVNPIGNFRPIECKPLSARLDTFDGKKILLAQVEADPVIMPALYERLVKDYPKTNFMRTISSMSQNPPRVTAEEQKTLQGMIIGVGW